jgi:hypothetical protein
MIPDLAGLPDDRSHSMINKEELTDPSSRVDLDSGQEPRDLGNETREKRDPQNPKDMGDPM